jgi:alpha-tubulin suppressor-like RCC1 family protein
MTGVVDMAADGLASLALREDGRVEYWGLGVGPEPLAKTPTTWVKGTSYTSIGFGSESACGLRNDGTVECWGSNEFGQLGNPEKGYYEQPVAVAGLTDVARSHCVAAIVAC